jgi:glucose/mannose transport system substrate-binding protein
MASVACATGASKPGPAKSEPAPSVHRDGNRSEPIEVFSWWARIGESDALGALTIEHQLHYPGDSILNATSELSGLARKTLRARMEHGDPPDTFQANIGRDLMRWVLVNGIDDHTSKLTALDGVMSDVAEWRQHMPAVLLSELSFGGQLYAVPANVHRLNDMYYNRAIFRTYGLDEPKTVDDLIAIGRKLAGTSVVPIALGSRDPWTLELLVFECLLVSREGPAFYDAYFRGAGRPDDPRVLATLRVALDLLLYVNADHGDLTWLEALDMLISGRAAMTVMGDWAAVSLRARDPNESEGYGEVAFPGSEGTMVYTSDTFPLPVRARNRAGAIRLLHTLGSVEGQLAMNRAKMALPARLDAALPEGPMFLRKRELLEHGPLVLALSGLVPAGFADSVGEALQEMAVQRDIEPVVQTLRSRYALLH